MQLPFKVTSVFWSILKVWDKYEVIVLQGGTSSSKTYSALQLLHLKALEQKRVITVCGQDLPNLKSGAKRDFEEIIQYDGNGIDHENKSELTYYYTNGSIIEFKSFDDPQDAKSGKRDLLFCNEVNGISELVFNELADRTKEKVIIDYNPTTRFWVHKSLLGQPHVVRLISNYRHNEYLSESMRRKIERHKYTNPERWKVYGLGVTGQLQGAIFKNVEWIKAKDMPHPNFLRKYGYGMDYGYVNDPTTLVVAGVQGDRIYARALVRQTGLTTGQIVEEFKRHDVDPWDLVSMDDSQAKEQAETLRSVFGFNVQSANRSGGTIKQGIELLKDYKLYIVDDEDGHWQEEQDNYIWDPKSVDRNNPKPVDKFNHYWDALRYWALEFLTEPEPANYQGNYGTV